MSERPKEHDWKSCVRVHRTEGSNPSLCAKKSTPERVCFFAHKRERDSKPTVKKCSCGAFLGRSAYETLPKNVNPRFGMIVLL